MITVNVDKIIDAALNLTSYFLGAVFLFFTALFVLMCTCIYVCYNVLAILIKTLFHLKDYACYSYEWIKKFSNKVKGMPKGFKLTLAVQFIACLVLMLILVVSNAPAVALYGFAVVMLLSGGAYLYWIDAMLE